MSEDPKMRVRLTVAECDRFGAVTSVGYGTWAELRHQRPTGKFCSSAWRLYRANNRVLALMFMSTRVNHWCMFWLSGMFCT